MAFIANLPDMLLRDTRPVMGIVALGLPLYFLIDRASMPRWWSKKSSDYRTEEP